MTAQRPVVAIVGRPNVGKSTLFNRLVGHARALVADLPGVTRDRLYADATLRGERDDYGVVLCDTGGLDPASEDPIMRRVLDQGQLAVDEADVVLFLTDGRAGLLGEDADVADRLRKSGKPIIVAVNKLDGDEHEALAADFFRLGLEPTIPISAAHGRHIRDLEEAIIARLPTWARPEPPEPDRRSRRGRGATDVRLDEGERPAPVLDLETAELDENAPDLEDVAPTGPIRVAVIGRPNVGKSSLVNRILGEDRHLVSDVAGTTRDAVDSLVVRHGKEYLFIDTAGIRRKRSIALRLEQFSVIAALKGLDRSDVALLLLDPSQGIAEQDAKVAAFAYEKGKAVVLVISKWDQRPEDAGPAQAVEWVHESLPHLAYAPVVVTSSHTGYGLDRLFPVIDRVYAEHSRRIGTGALNRFIADLMEKTPPPTKKGRRGRIYYMRQIGASPPRFLASVNDPELIHFSYRRFVINELRKQYGFEGVPVLIGYRGRSA